MSRLKVIHKAALAILGCCVLATASAFAQTGAKLTDPQIADIVYTANTIDIKNADLALQKSHNKDVRAFAEDMVRDHTAVNNQALALVKKLNVKPEDNATSEAYVKQASAERARLSSLNGSAFDKAYVANEVAYHKAVINALTTTLIPSTQNAELKGLLQTALPIFEGHEKHAEQLDGMLK